MMQQGEMPHLLLVEKGRISRAQADEAVSRRGARSRVA